MGTVADGTPQFQLGPGCLVDQLVGQYMAHAVGLGYLVEPAHVRQTLRSIFRHNYRQGFHDHFNHLRTFTLNDEAGLLMATWPRGGRPESAFPYYNELMTGFEYTAAVGMLQERMVRDGLRCIRAIRDRYDGRKRSPFNEAECGHHYARAPASWTAVLALTGFDYNAVTGTMRLAAARRRVRWFWSTGNAWGTVEQEPRKQCATITVKVRGGRLRLRHVERIGGDQRSVFLRAFGHTAT